jgi:Fe-S cluster biogenesis protein NfuA
LQELSFKDFSMSESTIRIENTPNPRTLKFVSNHQLLETGGRDYPTHEKAQTSPLARRLFALDGVDGVYIGTNFVTVSRTEAFDWPELAPRVSESVLKHLVSGEAILGAEGVQAHKQASAGDDVARRVQEVLDEYIRPAVAQDGGDVIFDSYEDGVVRLQLQGSCSGCPSSTMTLKMGIQNMLREQIPEVQEVIQV